MTNIGKMSRDIDARELSVRVVAHRAGRQCMRKLRRCCKLAQSKKSGTGRSSGNSMTLIMRKTMGSRWHVY